MLNYKRLIAVLFVALFTTSLAACNTMAGLGEDIEEAGDEIEECAEGVDC